MSRLAVAAEIETPVPTWGVRVALVAMFAAIVCARMPDVLLHGRFWAEEGRTFYVEAATASWWRALTFVFGGYLNLVANTAPLIARQCLPLEAVPWFTTGIGLLFQCCPAILLVCSRDGWLRSRWALVAALLLIATPPLTEEVWLQTLHSQFHLALCCALILALDIPGRRLRWFGWFVLLLAPLCGPPAWLLVPCFLLRAAFDRSPARLVQASFLIAGTLVQIAFFYVRAPGRSYGIEPLVLLCVIFVKQVVVPLAGRDVASGVSAHLLAKLATGHHPLRPAIIVLVLSGVLAWVVIRRRHPAPAWLLLAAIALGGAAYYGAIGGGARLLIIGYEGRYSFLPEVLTALTVLAVATGTRRPDAWLARIAVCWLLIVGMADIAAPSLMKAGPEWLPEVARWRRDHAHPIAIWPPGWTMRLNAQ